MSAADQQAQEERQERGERTAENIRYGQAISEGGMGGQTNTVEGETQSQGTALPRSYQVAVTVP